MTWFLGGLVSLVVCINPKNYTGYKQGIGMFLDITGSLYKV